MNICLLMMGGSGVRFGADRPKQFIEIDNKPVFTYILSALNATEEIDQIIVVAHCDWIQYVKEWAERLCTKKLCGIVSGGDTRSDSVKSGLLKAKEFAKNDDIILIHDVTHPYVDKAGMKELICAVNEVGAATMVQRQYDTCYNIDDNDMLINVTPRKYVVAGASPEAFRFGDIFDIYMKASEEELLEMTSAGAIALANGIKMKVCTLNTLNLKITYPTDVEILKKNPQFFFE